MSTQLSVLKGAVQGIDFRSPISIQQRNYPVTYNLVPRFRGLAERLETAVELHDLDIQSQLIGHSRTMEVRHEPACSGRDSITGNAALDVLEALAVDPEISGVMAGRSASEILWLGRNIFREYDHIQNNFRHAPSNEMISPVADAAYWSVAGWVDRPGLVSELKATGIFEKNRLMTATRGLGYADCLNTGKDTSLVTYYFTSFVDLFIDPSSDLTEGEMINYVVCAANQAETPETLAARQAAFNVISAFRNSQGIATLLRAFTILGCSHDIAFDLVALAEKICNTHYSGMRVAGRSRTAVLDQFSEWASAVEQ